jgi:hypothetical protein
MSEKPVYRQIGAQEKCPCGSGKTYIDCCLDGKTRWLVDDDGNYVKMQNFKGNPDIDKVPSEEIPLLRLDVSNGSLTYAKNSHLSRLASFPPDMLKMSLSVLEVEKNQAMMEAFGKYLNRTQFFESSEDDQPDRDSIPDGSYILVMISVNSETGSPLGMGGQRISNMLSESSLYTLIGALEEIKTDINLCLMVNCLMNGMIGSVDYGEEE